MKRAALLVVMALGGCVHAPLPPPGALSDARLDRFYQVAPYLFRSAQPNAQQLQIMHASYGVEETIKLNHAWEAHEPAVLGVTLVQRPWSNIGPVEHEDVVFVLDEMDACTREHRKCDLHCSLGRDRTGLGVALWKVRNHLATPDQAFAEWIAYGSERFLFLEETFEREVHLLGYPNWKRPK